MPSKQFPWVLLRLFQVWTLWENFYCCQDFMFRLRYDGLRESILSRYSFKVVSRRKQVEIQTCLFTLHTFDCLVYKHNLDVQQTISKKVFASQHSIEWTLMHVIVGTTGAIPEDQHRNYFRGKSKQEKRTGRDQFLSSKCQRGKCHDVPITIHLCIIFVRVCTTAWEDCQC